MNTLKQPMEIVKNIDIDINKRTIFLDVDDILLDSSAAVVKDLYNYGIQSNGYREPNRDTKVITQRFDFLKKEIYFEYTHHFFI